MRVNISSKLWITLIIILIVGSAFYYLLTIYLYEDLYVEHQKQHLLELGTKVAVMYTGGNITDDYRTMVVELNRITNEEVVLAESTEDLSSCLPIEGGGSDQELSLKLEGLYQGEIVSFSGAHAECDQDIIAIAVPLMNDDNRFVGTIFAYTPLATISEAISTVNSLLILYILVFLLLGIIVGKFVTSKLTKPLREMESVAKKMMDGDFTAKVKVTSTDEVGNLGHTLNHLSISLAKMIDLFSKEKSQLGQILDGISDSVLTIDNRENFVLCNHPSTYLLKKLGISKEEFIKNQDIQKLIKNVTDNQQILIDELAIQGHYFILFLAPLIEEKSLWGIVIVIHDITAERIREKETREFLAMVSHELRTPLSFVQGYTEALLDDVAESKELHDKYLQTIHNETQRMGRLVNDLLDLEQLANGTYPINKDRLLLDKIVEQVVSRYQSEYAKKGVNLRRWIHSEEPFWLLGDEDKIIQILINLLDNALRHTPSGGDVTVETSIVNNELILSITDTGEGIDQSLLDKIGQKFFRACEARSRKHGGVGLGLAIVKQIVEKHDGRIEVESELNRGTTFTLYFPLLK